jgi:putative oxidoreductase
MANPDSFFYRWSPIFLSILRIVSGLLIMEHGTQKLFDFPPGGGAHGPLDLTSLMGIGAIIEFGGGLLLVLGLFTRVAAFILSGEMAVAYFMVHASGQAIKHVPPTSTEAFFPIINKGELAVAYCFIFLFIFIAGAGAWSIDAMWKKGPATANPVT